MNKLFIENVSRDEIIKGEHSDPSNAILIQISDPGVSHPTPKKKFKETYQLNFLDADESDVTNDVCAWESSVLYKCGYEDLITPTQAEYLCKILVSAMDDQHNVIVHCHAGICRSGAVVEVGSILGFEPTNRRHRIPNMMVKRRMMQYLGLTYE